MMKSKVVKNERLYEHTDILIDVSYPLRHAYKREGKYILFAGGPSRITTSTEVIDHGELTDYQISCLQIILSYGLPVSNAQYAQAIKKLLMCDPTTKMQELCNVLYADAKWLKELLKISDEVDLNVTCVINAHGVSMLAPMSSEMLALAKHEHPNVFMPRVHELFKEQRKARKASK